MTSDSPGIATEDLITGPGASRGKSGPVRSPPAPAAAPPVAPAGPAALPAAAAVPAAAVAAAAAAAKAAAAAAKAAPAPAVAAAAPTVPAAAAALAAAEVAALARLELRQRARLREVGLGGIRRGPASQAAALGAVGGGGALAPARRQELLPVRVTSITTDKYNMTLVFVSTQDSKKHTERLTGLNC